MNKGRCEGRPPTSTGFPVTSGQHPDSSGGSTAICHPQVAARVSSLILGANPHSLGQSVLVTFTLVRVHKHQNLRVSDLSFYSYLWSLYHCCPSAFCSFRSRPERSPHLLLIFSVMLTRFTASVLITLIRYALLL